MVPRYSNARLIGNFMPVVVVESPAKAKTINKYLGSNYTVPVSYTHLDVYKRQVNVRSDRIAFPASVTPALVRMMPLPPVMDPPLPVARLLACAGGMGNICLLYTSRCV